jgi:predicted thioesterase
MKRIFNIGDRKYHSYCVKAEDVAAFQNEVVHPVCSTYVLAREMEWAGRLFVLDLREDHEEGIGTRVLIEHIAPAFPGEELTLRAEVTAWEGNELICSVLVTGRDGREIARGETGQKIMDRARINRLFTP